MADEMGYYPDPTLQALVAYRKGRLSNRPRETLAYMTDWSTRWGWRAFPAHERAYVGAQRKAAELGYQLEHFWMGEPGMNQRRMSNMFYHRGINGMLVAAHTETSSELSEIDWSRLSAVKIGCFPHGPAFHRVIDDHGGMVRLAMRRILAAGFERVGLVTAQAWDSSADQAWSAGFLAEQAHLPANRRIRIFRQAWAEMGRATGLSTRQSSDELVAFAKWHQDCRPDVIVGTSPVVLDMISRIQLTVPRNVAYVDLCLERVDRDVAGVWQNGEIAGEVATSMLVGQLQHNVYGTPAVGTSTIVDATWIDGATLPTVKASVHGLEGLGARARLIENASLATA
jgi:LacI family transcriptional regulator